MERSVEGIVSAVRLEPDLRDNIYTVVSGSGVHEVKSGIVLEPLDRISLAGDEVSINGRATNEDYESAISGIVNRIGLHDGAFSAFGDRAGPVAKVMSHQMVECAKLFLKSYMGGAPIVVRFHNDGDGASGAVAIYRALAKIGRDSGLARQPKWRMHRGVSYDMESFYSDMAEFGNTKSIEKPLLLITDFGTAPESEKAIELAREQANIIWFDHHMPYAGFRKELVPHYVNPWEHGGDSNFTAGLLCCVFSSLISGIDNSVLAQASFISDYSDMADRSSEEGHRTALLLDHITSAKRIGSVTRERITPGFIDSIISDSETSGRMYREVRNSVDEALALGLSHVKRYTTKSGNAVSVLDFEHISRASDGAMLPGRYSSRLHEKMEEISGDCITIVHYGQYISLRVSRSIAEKVGLLVTIGNMKKFEEYVESGGGHNQAGSIRMKGDYADEVMPILLRELGVKL
ncbi:MAG: hypothetical protein KGH98_03015 [Candidatus Micrarchaeota archaeon]|nr:hypothetical protein [Candidatus Micrarchaeota archaeon]